MYEFASLNSWMFRECKLNKPANRLNQNKTTNQKIEEKKNRKNYKKMKSANKLHGRIVILFDPWNTHFFIYTLI